MRDLPETIYSAVERVLDEHSAWIARPNPEVTKAVALAAGIAWSLHTETTIATQAAEIERLRAALAEAERTGDSDRPLPPGARA